MVTTTKAMTMFFGGVGGDGHICGGVDTADNGEWLMTTTTTTTTLLMIGKVL